MVCGNCAAVYGIVDSMDETVERTRAMGPPRHGLEDKAVEAWVRHDLGERYDQVLNEKLPAEMLALLAELA